MLNYSYFNHLFQFNVHQLKKEINFNVMVDAQKNSALINPYACALANVLQTHTHTALGWGKTTACTFSGDTITYHACVRACVLQTGDSCSPSRPLQRVRRTQSEITCQNCQLQYVHTMSAAQHASGRKNLISACLADKQAGCPAAT